MGLMDLLSILPTNFWDWYFICFYSYWSHTCAVYIIWQTMLLKIIWIGQHRQKRSYFDTFKLGLLGEIFWLLPIQMKFHRRVCPRLCNSQGMKSLGVTGNGAIISVTKFNEQTIRSIYMYILEFSSDTNKIAVFLFQSSMKTIMLPLVGIVLARLSQQLAAK